MGAGPAAGCGESGVGHRARPSLTVIETEGRALLWAYEISKMVRFSRKKRSLKVRLAGDAGCPYRRACESMPYNQALKRACRT